MLSVTKTSGISEFDKSGRFGRSFFVIFAFFRGSFLCSANLRTSYQDTFVTVIMLL